MATPEQKARWSKSLLSSQAFQEALEALRSDYVDEWVLAESTEAREAAWYGTRALGDLVSRLEAFVNDGEMQARRRLKEKKPS